MMQSFYEELETVMEHDNRAKSKGKVTKFKRTNRQSEEVARKFVIMRRLQLKLENITSRRHGLNNIFHDTCTNLTTTFKASHLVFFFHVTHYSLTDLLMDVATTF